jgi:hypothetical protein
MTLSWPGSAAQAAGQPDARTLRIRATARKKNPKSRKKFAIQECGKAMAGELTSYACVTFMRRETYVFRASHRDVPFMVATRCGRNLLCMTRTAAKRNT